jgi:CRISPR system Cascade subunit CasE
MFLHRIHLDPRCREARRDLADPYQFHATLCRAFSPPDRKCPEGEILWRLEPETRSDGFPRVLVQSRTIPDWDGIGVKGWLAEVDSPIDLKSRLRLDAVTAGQRFRFRLRANPCVTRNGKRQGLLQLVEQEQWMKRKGTLHGFVLPQLPSFDLSEAEQERVDVRVSQEQMLSGRQNHGNSIRIFSVLYDGVMTVSDASAFMKVLQTGIGHGKALGLGLLSVAPIA